MCLRHISVAGPPYVRLPLTCQIALEHCQCHIGLANYGNMWHGSKSLVSHSIVVVMWHSTAELTPLRSVRPSYRFLRPRSRENLSPAGTSHFPRPWAGHVRRIRLPDHDTSYPAWSESVDTNTEQSTYKQAGRRHSHPYNTLIIRYHLFPAWIFDNFFASNPHQII